MARQSNKTKSEVSAELDRLDTVLGWKMRRFDSEMGEAAYLRLMAECELITAAMDTLCQLEAELS